MLPLDFLIQRHLKLQANFIITFEGRQKIIILPFAMQAALILANAPAGEGSGPHP